MEMKMWDYIKIITACWGEFMALVKHVRYMLPIDEQEKAVKHVLRQGKVIVAKDLHARHTPRPLHVKVQTWSRDQMKDFDMEDY